MIRAGWARRLAGAVGAAGACLSALSCGCAQKAKVEVWTPKPLVHWAHLTDQSVTTPHNGYRILSDVPVAGLFPSNLVVTRVGLEIVDEQIGLTRPLLLTDPRNEFLQWNSALDDQMAISEVFSIAPRDLGGGEAEPAQILAAFRALHGRLGLVYAVNELNAVESEMFGVLYETATTKPIATFHTRALSVEPPEDDCEEDVDADNPWKIDSRALVRAEFERHLHACIRELISRDQPAAIESREGWTPVFRPVEWPPRHRGAGSRRRP